jgi:hypothetical protein
MGSYDPFYESLPKGLGKYLLITLFLIIFILLLFKKDPAARRHFVIFLASFFGIYLAFNLISYLVDLRIARYYIFLLPYLLIALTFAIPTRKSRQLFCMVFFGGLLLSQVLFINPYFSKRESFGNFVSNLLTMQASTGAPTMGCGYSFHNWYMKQSGLLTCDDPKDLKVFGDYRGLLIYGYLGQQLSGLIYANQNRIIRNIFPFSDGKIVWLSEKFSGVKNEK